MRILLVALALLAPAFSHANGVERGDKMDIFPGFPASPMMEQFIASRLNKNCDLRDNTGSLTNQVLVPLAIQRSASGKVEITTEVDLFSATTGQKVETLTLTSIKDGELLKVIAAHPNNRCSPALFD